MRKFGFKFFSTNFQTSPETIEECLNFVKSKPDMFVELMTVPSSTIDDFKQIKQLTGNVEVRIHAPYIDFDTGNREMERHNKKLLAVAQHAADIFDSATIVVHGGCGHERKYVEETARQFKKFNDERIVVENIPYYGCNGELLHGNTAEEIAYIMHESGCGFCFDFSHAICAALSLNIDIETQLKELYNLKPRVYHMCDGYMNKDEDMHLHFGTGNYPLKHFLQDYTAENAYITMETGAGFEQHNDLRMADYEYLKSASGHL